MGLLATWIGDRFGDHMQTVVLALSIPAIAVAGWRLLFACSERLSMRDALLRRIGVVYKALVMEWRAHGFT